MSNLPVKRIFIHCSDTRPGLDIGAATIRKWHTTPVKKGGRGWKDIGYHYVVRLDGNIEKGRLERTVGAHTHGFNQGAIAICYIGGLDAKGRPADTRTPKQKAAIAKLVKDIATRHKVPAGRIEGHRDKDFLDRNKDGKAQPSEWLKMCPCFDVGKERDGWLS